MKKTYSAPKLREYGSLLKLTEGCMPGLADSGGGFSIGDGNIIITDGCGPGSTGS